MIDSPLPRMWYLPDGNKTLMVNTGDAESYSGSMLDHTLDDAASYGGAFTSYLIEAGIAGTDAAKERPGGQLVMKLGRMFTAEETGHLYCVGPCSCPNCGRFTGQI